MSVEPHLLADRAVLHLVRDSLTHFATRAFAELYDGKRFLVGRHVLAIAEALSDVMRGRTRRLIISMPPRMGKSHLGSISFPAFVLGHDPTKRIITASYAQKLSLDFSIASRKIMEAPWYRAAFPAMKLDPAHRNTMEELHTTKGGSRFATSVGGALLGRGGDIMIVDDALSGDSDASEAERNSMWNWFQGVASSRLDNQRTGSMVVIGQRLHPRDLTGRLLEAGGWIHLELPAIAERVQVIKIGEGKYWRREPGELLQEERFGIPELETLRRQQGDRRFNAQYQQRPSPPEGTLFRMDRFGRFDRPAKFLRSRYEAVLLSVDSALSTSSTADYTAISVWGINGHDIYLLRAKRGRWSVTEQLAWIEKLYAYYDGDAIFVENAASGPELRLQLEARRYLTKHFSMRQDKLVRAESATLLIEQGLVHLPRQAKWLEWVEEEIALFPGGAHDDLVDSMTLVLKALATASYPELRAMSVYAKHPHRRPPPPVRPARRLEAQRLSVV